MAFEDIGYTIFAEVLGMQMYPGSPFTGEIVKDLILFLFVPSVFIIMFKVVLLGRIVASEYRNLRLLVGIAIYMFIIASGYYAAFALIAGPYFVFLIFILGAIYFIPGHFGIRGGGGGEKSSKLGHARGITHGQRVSYLEDELKRLESELVEARRTGSKEEASFLRQQIEGLREELGDERDAFQPWRKRH